MAEDVVSIIRIETGQAVKSVNDLKENIKTLKEDLGKLDIGSQEYQDTLHDLQVNQKALKDAMYATSSSMEEVAANAKGLNVVFDEHNKLINQENQSYNALVNTMAELKTRWRATADEATRAELGEQIKQINDQLKDMDASVGNFSRSVGDYTNSVKKALGDFPRFADPAKKVLKDMNDTMSLVSSNPMMGVIALITPLVVQLTSAVKENEDSMSAINKVMTAMKPVMDFFKGILEQVVTYLTSIISGVAEFLGNSGIFNKLVEGVAGVGNAILKFVVAPFKGVIEAIKVFKEQGVKGLGNAAKAFAQEMKSGVAFKSNFQAGQAIADGIIAGVKDKKEEVKSTAAEIGKEVGKELGYNVQKEFEKALSEANRKFDAELKERLDLQKELDQMTEDELARTNAEIEKYFAEQDRIAEDSRKKQEQIAKAKIQSLYQVADATASIFDSLADIYESNDKENEKNAKKTKELRIASTILDTISGAVAAFTSVWKSELSLAAKVVTAPLMSASVVAAGMAQVAKMKSVTASGSASLSAPAVTTAPVTNTEIPQMRTLTSASEEDRLNQMASDQRVVLVMSDLETKQNQTRVQVAESSF